MSEKQQPNEAATPVIRKTVNIAPPKMAEAIFQIRGLDGCPLVIHRFSSKVKNQMKLKMETGKAAGSKKDREAKSTDDLYREAKYTHRDGWEGYVKEYRGMA